MNRRDRRTRGKTITARLTTLKNSSLLQEETLKDLPQETIDQLIAGTCENKELQRKYKYIGKIMSEVIELEMELLRMKNDLAEKQKKD